jgi:hypothetical protein
VSSKPAGGSQSLCGADLLGSAHMLSFVVSTVAFFVASFFIKRYLDDMGIPKGFTRSIVIFCLALMIAYGSAFVVDWAIG